jgi:hypothetical protein
MISVGLDITRLGLMVVLGQPKSSAEYIQATSRVGRNADAPGLVVTLLNVHKPRDRSHYEHFIGFHRTFYRAVEATSVTPFSPRALDRALAAALIAICRHSDPAFTPALGASVIMAKRQQLEDAARLFARRAEQHDGTLTAQEASELHDKVLHRCRDLLDTWLAIQQDRQSSGSLMQYQVELRSGGQPPADDTDRFRLRLASGQQRLVLRRRCVIRQFEVMEDFASAIVDVFDLQTAEGRGSDFQDLAPCSGCGGGGGVRRTTAPGCVVWRKNPLSIDEPPPTLGVGRTKRGGFVQFLGHVPKFLTHLYR